MGGPKAPNTQQIFAALCSSTKHARTNTNTVLLTLGFMSAPKHINTFENILLTAVARLNNRLRGG